MSRKWLLDEDQVFLTFQTWRLAEAKNSNLTATEDFEAEKIS